MVVFVVFNRIVEVNGFKGGFFLRCYYILIDMILCEVIQS